MNPKPAALIFSTVWPEPESSAAGVRQLQWVRLLKGLGFHVTLSSPSKQKEPLHFEVDLLPLPLNQSSVKDALIALSPELVLFDRFILEEQFGHFVYEACPNALVLLETQDLHFVRRAREEIKEELLHRKEFPSRFYHTDTALRETASILRVDYSYVVSSFETELLAREFEIGQKKVDWLPFAYETPVLAAAFAKSFSEREGFVWVGNFRHPPNVDGLRWFRSTIWPEVKAALPGISIRIYGAYPSEEVMSWHQPSQGFQVLGHAPELETVFETARVNLAPLRFGAGIKGKILEGFRRGLPVVTTSIGAEGLMSAGAKADQFPGRVADENQSFAQACIELYQSEKQWNDLRLRAEVLLKQYDEVPVQLQLSEQLAKLKREKNAGLLPDWTSRILRHELSNSRKYFSKWIEEKEKINK